VSLSSETLSAFSHTLFKPGLLDALQFLEFRDWALEESTYALFPWLLQQVQIGLNSC